jgi:hypothetical protein
MDKSYLEMTFIQNYISLVTLVSLILEVVIFWFSILPFKTKAPIRLSFPPNTKIKGEKCLLYNQT